MPQSDAYGKTDRLQHLQMLFWRNPGRQYRTREIADIIGVSEDTAGRYLDEMSSDGRLPIEKEGWYWRLMEGARFELMPVKLNLAEGAALFLAARLLSQIHDERNEHVLLALTKLITSMPATIAPHLHTTVGDQREHIGACSGTVVRELDERVANMTKPDGKQKREAVCQQDERTAAEFRQR